MRAAPPPPVALCSQVGEQYTKAAVEAAEELADRKERKKGVAPQPPKAS